MKADDLFLAADAGTRWLSLPMIWNPWHVALQVANAGNAVHAQGRQEW